MQKDDDFSVTVFVFSDADDKNTVTFVPLGQFFASVLLIALK